MNAIGSIPIRLNDLPTAEEAVRSFEERGNRLTDFGLFGRDPLRDNPDLVRQREDMFIENNPSFGDIFGSVACGNMAFLQEALLSFINITKALAECV